MKTKTVRNQIKYDALGKYEKYFYDNFGKISWLIILCPILFICALYLSATWHWYVVLIFVIPSFFLSLFMIEKFGSIDEKIYLCDDCGSEMNSLGTCNSHDMESVYECPNCKTKIYI